MHLSMVRLSILKLFLLSRFSLAVVIQSGTELRPQSCILPSQHHQIVPDKELSRIPLDKSETVLLEASAAV